MKRTALFSIFVIATSKVEAFTVPRCSSIRIIQSTASRVQATRLFESSNENIYNQQEQEKKTIVDVIKSKINIPKRRAMGKKEKPVPGIPTYKAMITFVATTILIWVSEPLLSIVDTTVVGQTTTNSVIQLAALGPATMVVDSSIYMTYFLSIATTNMIANALAQNDNETLLKSSSEVLGLSLCIGVIIAVAIFAFGRPLLSLAAGASASPELIRHALDYCRIRIAVAPFAIMGIVSQSICLACLDTRTPAVAVAAATFVNIVGDIFLVKYKKMGIRGAALATALATVTSCLFLNRAVGGKMEEWSLLSFVQNNGVTNLGSAPIATVVDGMPILNTNTTTSTDTVREERRFASSTENVNYFSLPDAEGLRDLIKLAGPIFFVMFGKILCYNAMTYRATAFGVAALATHNIMMRVFFFLGTFGDSISQASQTFLPKMIANKSKRGAAKLMKRLGIVAGGIGLFNLSFSRLVLKNCGSYFTTEASILKLMAEHSRFMPLALLLHPFIMLFEGATLASKDLLFLVMSYGVTMALLFAQLYFKSSSFEGVWFALFFFQVLRFGQFGMRVWKKTMREIGKDKGHSTQLHTP